MLVADMDMVQLKNRLQIIEKARRYGNPMLDTLIHSLYRAVLTAIAEGAAKMPTHLAREALKAEIPE